MNETHRLRKVLAMRRFAQEDVLGQGKRTWLRYKYSEGLRLVGCQICMDFAAQGSAAALDVVLQDNYVNLTLSIAEHVSSSATRTQRRPATNSSAFVRSFVGGRVFSRLVMGCHLQLYVL